MGSGLEICTSRPTIVSWNCGVPVIVRTPPPTAMSGRMPGTPERKPSSSDMRTSAPPEMMLRARHEARRCPVSSRPKPKLLRIFSRVELEHIRRAGVLVRCALARRIDLAVRAVVPVVRAVVDLGVVRLDREVEAAEARRARRVHRRRREREAALVHELLERLVVWRAPAATAGPRFQSVEVGGVVGVRTGLGVAARIDHQTLERWVHGLGSRPSGGRRHENPCSKRCDSSLYTHRCLRPGEATCRLGFPSSSGVTLADSRPPKAI